jgi:hypothetical protein
VAEVAAEVAVPVDVDAGDDTPHTGVDLDAMTKVELQQWAAEYGLPTTGTKAELVARIDDYRAGED